MNKSKRKLLIFSLIALFVVISAVSVVAIVFAATNASKEINKSLTLSWTASRDVYATVDVSADNKGEYSTQLKFEGSTATGNLTLGNWEFDSTKNGKLELTFVIKNEALASTTNDLTATLSFVDGSGNAVDTSTGNMTYTISGGATATPGTVTIAQGVTATLKLTFQVTNIADDATLSGNVKLVLNAEQVS